MVIPQNPYFYINRKRSYSIINNKFIFTISRKINFFFAYFGNFFCFINFYMIYRINYFDIIQLNF